MVKTHLKKAGFTVIELMVTMVVGAVLALTTGAMIVFGYMAWTANTTSVKIQNDVSLAMNVISREIRESGITEITIDSSTENRHQVNFESNSVRSSATSIVVSDDQLLYMPSGFVLVEKGLNRFTATINGRKVDVGLQVVGGGRANTTTANSSFFPRN